ncbi:7262_t:CDS:2 [Diversispora eburnea]|uniref:7262_t:CDS:1 n=1 Tax=Diversispora eburnea TaxID=1213867 RepID=A0A9N8YIW9_9GLOM|nr:7262_t:CDS:2 [Diversispora eburnea]
MNRWFAFVIQLTMMFFIWNALLIVIGCVSTAQIVIGFFIDANKVNSGKASLSDTPNQQIPMSAWKEAWHDRQQAIQKYLDGWYVDYMEKLVDVQQQQQEYWPQYLYNQQRYYYPPQMNIKGNVYDEDGNLSGIDENALTSNISEPSAYQAQSIYTE